MPIINRVSMDVNQSILFFLATEDTKRKNRDQQSVMVRRATSIYWERVVVVVDIRNKTTYCKANQTKRNKHDMISHNNRDRLIMTYAVCLRIYYYYTYSVPSVGIYL